LAVQAIESVVFISQRQQEEIESLRKKNAILHLRLANALRSSQLQQEKYNEVYVRQQSNSNSHAAIIMKLKDGHMNLQVNWFA